MDIITNEKLIEIAGEIEGKKLHEETGFSCLFDESGNTVRIHSIICFHPTDDDDAENKDVVRVDVDVWRGESVGDNEIVEAFAGHGYNLELDGDGSSDECEIKCFTLS